jgi:hypothetical protein
MPTEEVPTPPKLTKEQLLTMDKEELVDLLLMAVQAQELFTGNLKKVVDLLGVKAEEIDQLKNTIQNQEAELAVLRNAP